MVGQPPETLVELVPSVLDTELEEGTTWGIGPFRIAFSLRSFLPGPNSSLRRFSIAEAALLLMMAYIASRGLGVVRQSMFNAFFGTGPEANAFYAASRLPDTLFNLIAGGALTQAFVPVFVSYEQDYGQREAWRLASLVFNVMLVALTAVALVAEFVTPTFVTHLLVPGYPPAEQELTTTLTRIMLVQPLLLGLGTIVTAILSSKRQFLLPAVSIAVYNFGMIGGLLVSLAFPRVGIYGPTYGTLAAAACQVLVQVPALVKQGVRYTWLWNLKHPGLRRVMHLLIPGTLGVCISSIALIIDTAFISYFPDSASLSAIHNANMLFAFPVALFAQAIGQAALPKMSMQAANGSYTRLRMTILKVTGSALILCLPTAVLLCLLGGPVIRIIFQHGAFDAHSSELTFLALIGYAVGLPGTTIGWLLINGFYSLKDAWTPLLTNILALVIHILLILLLLHLMTGLLLVLAIPLGAAIASIAEAVVLAVLLFRRLKKRAEGGTTGLRP